MAESLSNIISVPSCRQFHRFSCSYHFRRVSLLPPPIQNLESISSSSVILNRQGLFMKPSSPSLTFSNKDFFAGIIEFTETSGSSRNFIAPARSSMTSHSGLRFPKTQKWWEKGLQPNMKEVNGANDLVDSLLNAGNKLVVVDFFSPGCGGCKALHSKLCQLAEMNPDVQFLQVNYEEHKSMCYSLGVHVLPFFRFYRGAHGRLCSFSCTNATIKKFKDALVKHNTDRCSLGPNKGLEEKELLALAANKELSFNYTPKPEEQVPSPVGDVKMSEPEISHSHLEPLPLPLPLSSTLLKSAEDSKENAFVR